MSTTSTFGCCCRSRSTAARAKAWRWMSRPTTRTDSSGVNALGIGPSVVTTYCGCAANAALIADVGSRATSANGPQAVGPTAELRRASSRTTVKRPEWPRTPGPGGRLDVERVDQCATSRPARRVRPVPAGTAGGRRRGRRPGPAPGSAASFTRSASRDPSAMAVVTARSISTSSSSVLSVPRHSRSQPARSARTAASGTPRSALAPAMSSASLTMTPANPSSVAKQAGQDVVAHRRRVARRRAAAAGCARSSPAGYPPRSPRRTARSSRWRSSSRERSTTGRDTCESWRCPRDRGNAWHSRRRRSIAARSSRRRCARPRAPRRPRSFASRSPGCPGWS